MAFTRTVTVQPYTPSPPPGLPGSEKLHYERELKDLATVINNLASALDELQAYVETLP